MKNSPLVAKLGWKARLRRPFSLEVVRPETPVTLARLRKRDLVGVLLRLVTSCTVPPRSMTKRRVVSPGMVAVKMGLLKARLPRALVVV